MKTTLLLLCAASLPAFDGRLSAEEMTSRVFAVPFDFAESTDAAAARSALEQRGIKFPAGATAASAGRGRIVVTHTLSELDAIEGVIAAGREPMTVQEVRVRVVSFATPQTALLAAAAAAPAGDAAELFRRLVDDVASGNTELASDTDLIVRSGQRSKIEGIVEFPYPTEYDIMPPVAMPQSLQFKNLGTTLECEANVGEGMIDLNIAPETNRYQGDDVLTITDFHRANRVSSVTDQPVFLAEKLTAQALCRSGIPVLLSVTRPADVKHERPGGAAQRSIATFVIATLLRPDSAKPAPAAPSIRQTRLHTVAIRLPAADALDLLAGADAGKTALYEACLERVARGKAEMASHIACLCRNGQRSKTEAIMEVPYYTTFTGSAAFRNAGDTVEWECTGDESLTGVNLAIDSAGNPIRSILTGSTGLKTGTVTFPAGKWIANFDGPPNEWRLRAVADAIHAESSEEKRLTDLWFVMARTDGAATQPPVKPRSHTFPLTVAGIFSVTAEEAAALASLSPEDAARELEEGSRADEYRLAGLAGSSGGYTETGPERQLPSVRRIIGINEIVRLYIPDFSRTKQNPVAKRTEPALTLTWPSAPAAPASIEEILEEIKHPQKVETKPPLKTWSIKRTSDPEEQDGVRFVESGPLEASFDRMVSVKGKEKSVLLILENGETVRALLKWLSEKDLQQTAACMKEKEERVQEKYRIENAPDGIEQYMEEFSLPELPAADGIARLAGTVKVKAAEGAPEHGRVHAVVVRVIPEK